LKTPSFTRVTPVRKIVNINEGWRFLKAAIPVETAMVYAPQGEAVTLVDLDDDPNSVTFEIDKFSTFALAYSDVELTGEIEGEEEPEIPTPELVAGDANGDGEVDFVDAVVVLKHDAGVSILSGDNLAAADTNGDEEVDFVDAIQILKYDCGLISAF